MQHLLQHALGWAVCLVILAIIGTITFVIHGIYGDVGAHVAFFGLLTLWWTLGIGVFADLDKR